MEPKRSYWPVVIAFLTSALVILASWWVTQSMVAAFGTVPVDGQPIVPTEVVRALHSPTSIHNPHPYAHPPQPTNTPTPTPVRTPACGLAWRIVTSQSIAYDKLNAISVVNANEMWAAGYTYYSGIYHPLVQRKQAGNWTIIQNSVVVPAQFNGIAALAPDNVWLVGFGQDSNDTLIEHWDGTTFTRVDAPIAGALYSISAVSANDIWAVGNTMATPAKNVLHWDGISWSVVPPPPGIGTFYGVDARAADDVWAVDGNIAHWNGTSWSSPNTTFALLYAVEAVSADDVWAVGSDSSAYAQIVHWNGIDWQVVPSPLVGGRLYGVSAISANDVWAVGTCTTCIPGNSSTLTEHWDGTAWTIAPSSNTIRLQNELHAVGAVSTGDAWAVGFDYGPPTGFAASLIEHWSDPCLTPTPTSTASATPSYTPTGTAIGTTTGTVTGTPTGAGGTPSATVVTTGTATPCFISFSDVSASDYFYEAVRYLLCHGAISGYGDNTFRPYNNTTRAQLAKIVVNSEGWSIDTSGGPHFNDVTAGSAFYGWVETAYNHAIISGYACGAAGEPCPGNYFRPNANVTRGQLSKIVVIAQGWPINATGGPHFGDVPDTQTFYEYIETAYNHAIISGYACGAAGEPCPGNYFRPGANATRGQIAKIVYNAITAR